MTITAPGTRSHRLPGGASAGDRQRAALLPRRGAGQHHRPELAARHRPHRRQGGLRRGRVRRLLRARRPAGLPGRRDPHAVDGDQRLPHPGRHPRRPGGRHLRGPRHAGRRCTRCSGRWRSAAAPSAATARPASSAAWRPSTTAPTGRPNPEASYDADETLDYVDHAESRARPQRLRPARAVAATSAAAPATGRSGTPPTPWVRPREDDAFAARLASPPPAVRHTRIAEPDGEFVRPTSLSEATALLGEHPDAVLVAGSTDWGVEVNIRGVRAAYAIAVDRLPELRGFEVGEDWVELGAALTLTEIERRLDGRIPLLDHVFPQFASRLIRNGATIGGNLGTGSPIGDTPPALLALEARPRAGVVRRRARGPAGGVLHRLPPVRPAARRADQVGADPVAAGRDQRLPQDRQAPIRRHLQRRRRLRDRRCVGR